MLSSYLYDSLSWTLKRSFYVENRNTPLVTKQYFYVEIRNTPHWYTSSR